MRTTIFCPAMGGLVLLAAMVAAQEPAQSRTADDSAEGELVVGTKSAPPFSIRQPDGEWGGISIELWRRVARRLGRDFRFEDRDLGALIDGAADGSLDVAVGALTVTPEREQRVDFSHPYHATGLGIAVPTAARGGWLRAVRRLLSLDFLKVVGAFALLLLGTGAAVWVFERRRNPEQFGGRPVRGIGAGFWWSAVTITTVGYGDKAPRTLGGRLVALVWMFVGLVVISSFIAAITSVLTISRLETPIRGLADLHGKRVATVGGTTSEQYLRDNRVRPTVFATAAETLEAVAAGEADAAVYDAPMLRYLVTERFTGRLRVLPVRLQRQDYALALPPDSPLREDINRALVEEVRRPEWYDLLADYLGE